jgi:cell division protein FtsW (lipid II flippase)
VPLPFISYGGTALLTLFIGIGVLMSVHSHAAWSRPSKFCTGSMNLKIIITS